MSDCNGIIPHYEQHTSVSWPISSLYCGSQVLEPDILSSVEFLFEVMWKAVAY